jgi:hypothetical protein
VNDPLVVEEIDSLPESRVRNSQPHGIGRVATLPGAGAWSNLGRNVVFVGPDLRPRAVFDDSAFSEDEPSQYDLDVHAILDLPGAGVVLTLNHFGTVRAFRLADVGPPGPLRRVAPVWTRTFRADVERTVVVDGRLVGSRPREEGAPGLLVSEPVGPHATRMDLDVAAALDTWGTVRALASLDGLLPRSVAIGGDAHVSLVALNSGRADVVGWDTTVDFEPAVLLFDGALVWAAGSEAGAEVDDYDWDGRHGGGFAALEPTGGHVVVRGRFDDDLAWGTGGVSVAVVPGGVCGVGRRGEIQVFDSSDGALVARTAPLADGSLGIAHVAVIGEHLVFGFNRGGYRLWTISMASVRDVARSGRQHPIVGPSR